MRRQGRGSWIGMVGVPCPVCGSDGQTAASSWSRFARWLRHGRFSGPKLRCVNGHQWAVGTSGLLRVVPLQLFWPARALQVVLRHRTVEPVPLLWLVGTVVGVGLGLVAQAIFAWAWWRVAVGWLAVMWLAMLATALRTSGRERLWIELV